MKKHLMAKEQIVCYAMLLFEAVAVASCYAIKINFWIHKAYIDASSAIIFCGIVLLVLLLASLLISLYFKQLAIEKKILIMLGSIAISLGVLGFADLVLENQLKYLDTIYKSLQLFVGEFEYVALYRRPVPPMINAARFLALFVTFGTIFTIILKQRIYGLNIKLFYRDVLIISNDPEGYVNDLANKLVNENRKVIIAYTKDTDDADQIASGKIPVVSIDIAKNIENDLKICNVKHARDIYLLCDCTLDNIKLVKSIYPMLKTKKKREELIVFNHNDEQEQKSIGALMDEYVGLLSTSKEKPPAPIRKKPNSVACYIQYKTNEERKYYSIDDVFTNRTDAFATYFINRYDISIRQMLSSFSIASNLDYKQSSSGIINDQLSHINVAVSGSGEMLDRAVVEIAKNCVYNSNIPYKLYLLGGVENSIELPEKLKNLVCIERVTAQDFSKLDKQLDLIFIGSKDEKKVQGLLEHIFQYDLQHRIRNYMILTDGNVVEYDILSNYIKGLLAPYTKGMKTLDGDINPSISLCNIKDLIPAVSRFYQKYAPTGKEIYKVYQNAIVNDELLDFNSLPERFIDSNILSGLHNDFILHVLHSWIEANEELKNTDASSFKLQAGELLEYLAATEHERWYNERTLQGFIYSKEKSQLYNKNTNLLHWDELSKKKRDSNIRYVLCALIAQLKKRSDQQDIYKDVISTYSFKPIEEE